MADKDKELVARAKRRFKLVSETDAPQRKREREDLEFQVPELQWDEAARRERMGGNGLSPRPMLSISLLQQPLQLIKNQAQAADLGVSVHPVSEKAGKDVAEIKEGLYSRIERDSNAEQVRLWALDRATQCGRGYYRIVTQYDEDGDNPFDQEIVIRRIRHQEAVYLDPAAQEADKRDAKWGFIVSWMPLDDFKRDYPKATATSAEGFEFTNLEVDAPGWVDLAGDSPAVLVAEYWEKEIVTTTLCFLDDGTIALEGQVSNGRTVEKERTREDTKLCWYKLTGFEVLDRENCDGKWIPIVFVPGRELQPFDKDQRFEGMVRPARDGQRLFNYAASSLVERMALEPKVPFVGYEGQFTDPGWKQVNIRNVTHLEVPIKPDGNNGVLPLPQRAQLDSTGMNLAMMALQEGKSFVQASTAVYDPSLGETPKHGQSGRAVIAQQQQSDAGTSNYLQNLATISMPYEAMVVLDLMPHVYDRPGRVTQILGSEDKEETVMLNRPYTMGPDGKPVAAMDPNQQGAKTVNLAEGKYAVSVSVGKSYQTRLQQGQESMSALIEHLPPEAQVLLIPTMLNFMDSPGSKEAADLMKKYRDSKFPALMQDKNNQPTPEQLQAELAATKQQAGEMQQQLQLATQQIQTDQAKQQGAIETAKIKAQSDIEIAHVNNAAKIEVARIGAAKEAIDRQAATQEELLSTGLKLTVQREQNDINRQHETRMANMDKAHEIGMAHAGGQTVTKKREGGQNQDQEQSQEQNQGQSSAKEPPQEAATK